MQNKRRTSGTRLMVDYLRLTEAERVEFDRVYTDRVKLQEMQDMLARATPEQLWQIWAFLCRGTDAQRDGQKRGQEH